MNEIVKGQIIEVVGSDNVYDNEPMSKHTTFKVGGLADLFVIPQGIKEAAEIVRLLLTNKEDFYVMGNGSNLLVSDKGYRGCVVCISKGMDYVRVDGNTITAGAGAILSKVAVAACDNNLDGMAFAAGIPGSVGGAVYMNAGAYGGEMKNIIKSVTVFDMNQQKIVNLSNDDMEFGYRYSIAKSRPMVILEATYDLKPGDSEAIRMEMNELATKRRDKQPLEYPSAGSTFKRPEGYFAGKLIEDAGLKGYTVGGAQVSQKHSGFVINIGGATATDIITLIKNVRGIVEDKFGVTLEPEVCMLGEDLDVL